MRIVTIEGWPIAGRGDGAGLIIGAQIARLTMTPEPFGEPVMCRDGVPTIRASFPQDTGGRVREQTPDLLRLELLHGPDPDLTRIRQQLEGEQPRCRAEPVLFPLP